MKNNDDLNLYDIFKENYEIGQRVEAAHNKKKQLRDELFDYGSINIANRNQFNEVERIIDLKKNLIFFFSKFMPFLIHSYLLENHKDIKSLDASKYKISADFTLIYDEKSYKYIYYGKSDYILPSDSDYNNFNELLVNFINDYHLGTIEKRKSDDTIELIYFITINTSLKDLIYACYVGEEWIKHIEDECLTILSDYYNEEQLASFKKTLHR